MNPFVEPRAEVLEPAGRPLPSPAFPSRALMRSVPPPVLVRPNTKLMRHLTTAICILLCLGVVLALFQASLSRGDETRGTRRTVEMLTALAILFQFPLMAGWFYCALRNARRICRQPTRVGPLAAMLLVIPIANIAAVGLILQEAWRHSTEDRQPAHRLVTFIMWFGWSFLLINLIRIGVFASAVNRPSAGAISAMSAIGVLLMLGGVVAVICQIIMMVSIERTQRRTYRYRLTKARY